MLDDGQRSDFKELETKGALKSPPCAIARSKTPPAAMALSVPLLAGTNSCPQLLVSVRSEAEAVLAVAGGAEILDVKEPSRGSLGMASLDEIREIAARNLQESNSPPLSVALGELDEWTDDTEVLTLPNGITFAKLGLRNCRTNSKWKTEWLRVRAEFNRRSYSKLDWVAVAYSDAIEACSPNIGDVAAAAIETGCAGLLIDTYTKDGRTLLNGVAIPELANFADELHAAGLFFALAGKLTHTTLNELSRIPVDVIAIRSAACVARDRTAELDQSLVTDFRNAVRSQFSKSINAASDAAIPPTSVTS